MESTSNALSWFVPAVIAGTFWTAAATLVAMLGPPMTSHSCAALLIVPFVSQLPWAGRHLPRGLVMTLTFALAWALHVTLFWAVLGGLAAAAALLLALAALAFLAAHT